MKKFIKNFLLSFLLPVAIIGGLAVFLFNNKDNFVELIDVSILQLLLLTTLILATWLVNSMQTYILIKTTGVKISYTESLITMIAMMLGNYLPGKFGTLMRMTYFKKVHGLNYSKFGGIISSRLVALFFQTAMWGIAGIVFLEESLSIDSKYLLMCFTVMLLISIALFYMPRFEIENDSNRLFRSVNNFMRGFNELRNQKSILIKIMVLIFIQLSIVSARLYIVFDIMNIEIPINILLLMGPVTTLISFVNITPGSLGVREWVLGTISVVTGIEFKIGIFACTIDSVVLMVCTFIFGTISLAYVYLKVRRLEVE